MDQPDDKRRNVLVVDDDEDFAESVTDILSAAGYDAARVATGRDARERVREHRRDVFLVDLRLGRENGADLIRAFRDQSPGSISVAMTAYSDPEAVVNALKSGAYDYLAKPFDPQELLATVRRCAERLTLQEERETALRTLEEKNRELLQVNARLAESEQRYREIFESTSDGIFMVERTADDRFRLLAYNPAQERMLGIAAPTAVGRLMEEYLPPGIAETLTADNRACVEAGVPIALERTLDLDEGRRYFSTILIPVKDVAGRVHRIIGVARDVTESRRSAEREREHEQQLFQAAKLATLGTLVSGIAHEINNPNNYIRLNAQNLREFWQDGQLVYDQVAAGDPSFALCGIPYATARVMIAELLAGIEGGSKRIEKLLLNLRDYARGEQGNVSETVDLNEVVASAVMLMRDLIGKSTDSFTVSEAESLPPIAGNYHQLEQVVINLVTNACQALRARGGAVTVITASDPEGSAALLEVSDEGVGIPEKDLPRITDPFFTTRRAEGGSGLGLAVSSRIIQNHGGTMQFSSRSGVGTVVRVRFPALRVRP